jgi:uncharacterized protein YhhL (DUF1145 family)
MVKRFFRSVFQFALLMIVALAAIWGVAQLFIDLPYGKDINKWLLFSFSLVIMIHTKDLAYDVFFWGRQVKKAYEGKEE